MVEDAERMMLLGIIDKLIACLAPEKLAEYESKKMEGQLAMIERLRVHKQLMNQDDAK